MLVTPLGASALAVEALGPMGACGSTGLQGRAGASYS
jgi:hypothetical protein